MPQAVMSETWQFPAKQPNGSDEFHSFIALTRNPILESSGQLLCDHTCYTAAFNSSTIHFCYPRVIVSGVPKAGTSAVYELLSEHPKFIGAPQKENCASKLYTASSMWTFFLSLEALTKTALNGAHMPAIMISGCIQQDINIDMHTIMRQPLSTYILMTRDLSDLIWASYNYWCSPFLDGPENCSSENGHWTDPKYHYRSPELFHELIIAQSEGKFIGGKPGPLRYHLFNQGRMGLYERHLTMFEYGGIPKSNVLLIASEDLVSNATKVWQIILSGLNINITFFPDHPQLNQFGKVRVNTGDNKGPRAISGVPRGGNNTSGLYLISKFMPMLPKTRAIISATWIIDCEWTSNITGFSYSACHGDGGLK